MQFDVETIIQGNNTSEFQILFSEIASSIGGLSETKIEKYFTSNAVGSRSKSLAGTIRALILNDLQLKGWLINWAPFKGKSDYEASMWNFDAAKQVEVSGTSKWITVEISFDNRIAIGTHLVKASVANNSSFRTSQGDSEIIHHCLITGTKEFKDLAGIDSSVGSSEEFHLAAGPYQTLALTRTTLISLKPLETIEVQQRKFDGRTKAVLQNLGISEFSD